MNADTILEKMIEIKLIQNDAETIISLMKSEQDPIFALAILPYYALFVQSCREYLGGSYIGEDFFDDVKDIRNYIKAFDVRFAKAKKRVNNVDTQQNELYSSMIRFDFMKSWNIHYNLGTYWTKDKHIVGNTQIYADFLRLKSINSKEIKNKMYDFSYKMQSFISFLKVEIGKFISPPIVEREKSGITIDYYCDLNTFKKNHFFRLKEKELSLFFLNLVSNLNFVKYILRPLLSSENTWLFRVEYVVTYYTYKALLRLKNYCQNNNDVFVDLQRLSSILEMDTDLFQSKFRNCMMHYGIVGEHVVSVENIDKPLYGMVETCYKEMEFCVYQSRLRDLEECLIGYLEEFFNLDRIILQNL